MRTFGQQNLLLAFRKLGHIDLIIARENTEGFYSDRSMFLGGQVYT